MLLPLLLAAAALQEPADHGLVCLVPQDEKRHFRQVVQIDPDSGERQLLLADLLYCFDAADRQRLWPLPEGGVVCAGPVSRSRPSPNVTMPLWLRGADGGREVLRGSSTHYAVSPDGRHVANADFQRLELLALDDEDREWQTLVAPTEESRLRLGAPLWSPDGAWLYVPVRSSFRGRDEAPGPAPGLWRWSADGSVRERVAELGGASLLAVEPGDASLLVHVKVGRDPHAEGWIERVHLDGGETELLVDDAASRGMGFDLAPDGERFVYLRRDRQLVLRERDGSSRALGAGLDPRFSPDGAALVFHRWEEGVPRLLLLVLASGERRDLGPGLRAEWLRGK